MTLRVIIEDPALGDLAAAIRWYRQVRPGLDADFRLCLRAAPQRLARPPESCPVVGRRVRRALLDRFPFAVFDRPDGDILHVFAVLHTSRDPRVWPARGR